ncbi:MAG: phosphoribosyltransferase [Flammeovirgaceae bacterium]|nr:phosphoribosyltransferase [Flammeovirgaceae bacterium]
MSTEQIEKSKILDANQIAQKVRRIAFEIFENNFKEKTIILAGIDGQGYEFAKLLGAQMSEISKVNPVIIKVTLDKVSPQQSEVSIDCEENDLHKKVIILVDDVLNTGRTLAYGMKPFLNSEVKKIEVAVLVNRSHTTFPILPTYTGHAFTTTLNDHVEVVLGKKGAVYLL